MAHHHFERGLAIDPTDTTAHHQYGRLLFEEFDAPEKGGSHLKTALQRWQAESDSENELYALRELARVCRALDDEDAAIEYCKRAIDLTDSNDDDSLWFESIHAILTDTNLRTRYSYSLTNILEDDLDLAIELFELIWTNRDEHTPESNAHGMARSAGITLAATLQLHDAPDSPYTSDEILNSIDPSQLAPPASTLYEHLDTETTATIEAPDESTEELPTLERRAFSYLLERLNK